MNKAITLTAIILLISLSIAGFVEANTVSVQPVSDTIIQNHLLFDSSLPNILRQIGNTYYLTADVNDSSPFRLSEVSDIVIDGQGFTIQNTEKINTFPNTGININGAKNVTIKNLQINGFQNGIALFQSISCTIDHVNFTNDKFAVQLQSSNSITVSNTTMTANNLALYLDNSQNNTITNNRLMQNQAAVQIVWSQNNVFTLNTISHNGIAVDFRKYVDTYYPDPTNNLFYANNFVFNLQDVNFEFGGKSNQYSNGSRYVVYDKSYANSWNFRNQGNYWSNYTGFDSNKDGIVDYPYVLYDFNNKDNYPLTQQVRTEITLLQITTVVESIPTSSPLPTFKPVIIPIPAIISIIAIVAVFLGVVALLLYGKYRKTTKVNNLHYNWI